MERILPGILLVATLLICRVDAVLQNRYGGGGGFKRPSHSGHPGGFISSYAPSTGSYYGSPLVAGSSVSYSLTNAPANPSHGSGGHGGSHNAPSGGHQQTNIFSDFGGYGQSSSYSASYSRPFGMPEGQRFPYGGFTHVVPDQRPPNPPIKSTYKSKPYPDFIVRFKSPLYPSEVKLYDKQDGVRPVLPIRPIQNGVAPVVPVYEPGEISSAEIPVLGSGGVNVGASYQTGGNIPISVDPKLPGSTSIYLINGGDTAADKFQLDSMEQPESPNSFVDLSKESVFGTTLEPGVIKPLTPDVVYSPEKNDDFKPMYIFGPVYFPKDADGKESVESKSTVTVKSEVEADDGNSTVINSTLATPTETSTKKPRKNNGAGIKLADQDDLDADAELDGGGGSRGLIGVLKGILGVDGNRDEDDVIDEHVSRGDKKKSKTKSSSRPKDDLDDLDLLSDDESPPKRRRRPSNASNRTRKPSDDNSRKGTGSNSRYIPGNKKSSNVGENNQEFESSAIGESKLDNMSPEPADPQQSIEGNRDLLSGELQGNSEDPDPIVGPVQIGYIGGPPHGVPYNPNQPFFYPAGIPAFQHNPLSTDFPQISGNNHRLPSVNFGSNINDQALPNAAGNVRRHYDTANNGYNDHVKSTSFYEGFEQQGYRDYAPGIPDQESADSSSSHVTSKGVIDSMEKSDQVSTTEYVTSDGLLSSSMSQEHSTVTSEATSGNEVTEDSPISAAFHSENSTREVVSKTTKSYTELPVNSTSYGGYNHVYASVTRRPFPSFYKYRTSFRPKNETGYVVPTTYRPASFRFPSRKPIRRPLIKVDALANVKDVSATIKNSVQDDHSESEVGIKSKLESTSESSNNAIVEPYHGMEMANSEALVQVHAFATDAPFGSRITGSLKQKLMGPN